MMAQLFTLRKKQLHPQANADDRFAILSVTENRLNRSALLEVLHSLSEGTYPGENKFLCGFNDVWISRDFSRRADLFKGLLN